MGTKKARQRRVSRAFSVHETVEKRLKNWKNNFDAIEKLFTYNSVEFIDRITNDEPPGAKPLRSRHAARHLFLQEDLKGTRKTVSIVIPTYGQPEALAECLLSISRQKLIDSYPETVEVIVVEDGIPIIMKDGKPVDGQSVFESSAVKEDVYKRQLPGGR